MPDSPRTAAWNFAEQLQQHGPDAPFHGMLDAARSYCQWLTRTHYENFTVASWLLPRRLRPHFHAIYSWCRWADDLADEVSGSEQSLQLLDWWRAELNRCYDGTPTHVVTVALNATLNQFAGFPLPASGRGVGEGRPRAVTGQHTGIPQQLFHDLISAFEQDQRVSDYDTFEQLVDYCRRSANPVGRLVLHLFECCDAKNAALSDEVCTGLQLANFWQDVARDAAIGRCYLPREDRERFANHRDLIRFEVERTRGYFQRGRALLPRLPRRARMDVALFISGGDAVLDAIAAQGYDVLTRRPVITKRKKAMLLARALCGL